MNLAIDPGASGGYAWPVEDIVVARPMPDTEGELLDDLRAIRAMAKDVTVTIEEVGGYVGSAQPGSAMFKFGRGFGFLLGACMALGYRVQLVRPQRWQSRLGLGTASSCASKSEWKRKLKAEAQRRFPNCPDITLKTADALLILDYAINRE